MLRKITIVGIVLMLASCATTEFREEKSICTATWMKKIPTRFEKELYNKRMSREVPTGKSKCRVNGFGKLSCEAIMTTEYYTVPAVRTVDRNESRRDAKISACTQNKCNQKYGNTKCKS